jgi:hypothetical protein
MSAAVRSLGTDVVGPLLRRYTTSRTNRPEPAAQIVGTKLLDNGMRARGFCWELALITLQAPVGEGPRPLAVEARIRINVR